MKVNIGPYLNWIGPYQIADAIFFWHEKYPQDGLAKRWDYVAHNKFAEWLSETWITAACQWIYDKRKRKVEIKIDKYDVWGMDHTLAMIILPMLKTLKGQKHGFGWVEPEDAPKNLRPTKRETNKLENKNTWDSKAEDRAKWLMDELIWTFEQLQDDDNDEQFWVERGEIDWDAGEIDENGCKQIVWKKKSKIDWDGLNKHHERIKNGLILFGKYYRSLWD